MAWTTPMTAVANSTFTAAQFNTYVRDNLNMTAPALASTSGQVPVSTGANSITMRSVLSNVVTTSQSTSSLSYVNLATVGPTVTVNTGTQAIVWIQCSMSTDTTNSTALASVTVSGASAISGDDSFGVTLDGVPATNLLRYCSAHFFNTLVPGSNVFTMVYKVGSNTGTFANRELIVFPL